MKFIALAAITLLIIFYYIGKSQASSTNNNLANDPSRMGKIFDNAENKHGFRVGKAAQLESSFKHFKNMSTEELIEALEQEDLSLYEISNALFMLANQYFQKEQIEQGMEAITISADDYHNPLAMVQLAKIAFHGDHYQKMLPAGSSLKVETDLAKAFYYVNRAFETCRALLDNTGQKFALDLCVSNGLGLLDSYQLQEIKEKFDPHTQGKAVRVAINQNLDQFAKIYQLK